MNGGELSKRWNDLVDLVLPKLRRYLKGSQNRVLRSLGICVVFAVNQAHADSVIDNLRVGEHPDKTRVVLDISESMDFTYKVVPEGFKVSFPDARWAVPKPGGGGLVEGAMFEPAGSGGFLTIRTVTPVAMQNVQVLSPDEFGGFRIVMDVVPGPPLPPVPPPTTPVVAIAKAPLLAPLESPPTLLPQETLASPSPTGLPGPQDAAASTPTPVFLSPVTGNAMPLLDEQPPPPDTVEVPPEVYNDFNPPSPDKVDQVLSSLLVWTDTVFGSLDSGQLVGGSLSVAAPIDRTLGLQIEGLVGDHDGDALLGTYTRVLPNDNPPIGVGPSGSWVDVDGVSTHRAGLEVASRLLGPIALSMEAGAQGGDLDDTYYAGLNGELHFAETFAISTGASGFSNRRFYHLGFGWVLPGGAEVYADGGTGNKGYKHLLGGVRYTWGGANAATSSVAQNSRKGSPMSPVLNSVTGAAALVRAAQRRP